jgi:hypothetical protein
MSRRSGGRPASQADPAGPPPYGVTPKSAVRRGGTGTGGADPLLADGPCRRQWPDGRCVTPREDELLEQMADTAARAIQRLITRRPA